MSTKRAEDDNPLEYEVYFDGDAGWAWAGMIDGRAIILSTNHENEFAANLDLETHKEKMKC